jgi:hypothetical protein
MDMSLLTATLEWSGSLLSIAGAHFNANGSPFRAYLCWIPSSMLLIAFAVVTGHWGLCAMQLSFLAYNLRGHWFWRRGVMAPRNEESGTPSLLRTH